MARPLGRTVHRENTGSNRALLFRNVWVSSLKLYCFISLSMNDYLPVDSGGYLKKTDLREYIKTGLNASQKIRDGVRINISTRE